MPLLDRVAALAGRPGVLIAAGVVLAVAAFQLWITPSNPPGFLHDEASMSYNAYTVSTTLRDENGALLPLYFKSFGDYKSPLFTYTLAAVFRVTGPHGEVARGLAAVAVLAGVLLLGLIAYRRTRSAVVAIAVLVLAGLTPGLFEVGRAAYEVSLQPLLLCLLLLALDRASRTASASPAAAPSTSTTGESPALAYARWYAAEHGLPQSRVVRLSDGGVPPVGSVVVVRFLGCDFTCTEFARSGDYWLARTR